MDLKQTWKVAKVDADWLPLLATANPRGDTAVADTRGEGEGVATRNNFSPAIYDNRFTNSGSQKAVIDKVQVSILV